MTLTAAVGEVLKRMGPGSAAPGRRRPRSSAPAAPSAAPKVDVNGEEAYGQLLKKVMEAAQERRLGRVMVEVMGMPMRAKVESADKDKITVVAAAGRVPVNWTDVRPVHFYGIASRALADDDAEGRLALARFCLWKGLTDKAALELEAAAAQPETLDLANALRALMPE